MKQEIWLIGSGVMAMDYIKVLEALEQPFRVIGRGEASAAACEEQTGHAVVRGGLSAFLESKPSLCSHAIVATGVETLAETTQQLLTGGVKRILVEKPAALHLSELLQVQETAARCEAQVHIAYNRRFYAATLHALAMIAEDGGVQSCNFEFTEWGHIIEGLSKGPGVKDRWFLCNSTHVVDLAFHLAGKPRQVICHTSGSLPWHPAASVFAGAGVTDCGALFSYQANWNAPGRWGLEVLTTRRRLIFRPMETLQIMQKGSVLIEPVAIDDSLDKKFKPGLYEQTSRFLSGQTDRFCTLDEHCDHWECYCRMAGYDQQP